MGGQRRIESRRRADECLLLPVRSLAKWTCRTCTSRYREAACQNLRRIQFYLDHPDVLSHGLAIVFDIVYSIKHVAAIVLQLWFLQPKVLWRGRVYDTTNEFTSAVLYTSTVLYLHRKCSGGR